MGYPRTSDGKTIVLTARYPGNVDPCFTGVGDSPESIGGGTPMRHSSDEAGDYEVVTSWRDWVYVAKGNIRYQGAQLGDHISLIVRAPATAITEAPSSDGDCRLEGDLILPASGDGTHNLPPHEDRIPIPALDQYGAPAGHWDWSQPDTGRGLVAPAPKLGYWYLLATPRTLVCWVSQLQMLGEAAEELHPETKGRRILPHWELVATIHNGGHAGLKVVWRLDTARRSTT